MSTTEGLSPVAKAESELDLDLENLRVALAGALGIRIEELVSRVSKSQPLSMKLFVAAYALNKVRALPPIGIAQFMNHPKSWVNFAIDNVDRRLSNNSAYSAYVARVVAAVQKCVSS
jgi:hypothetical protein